MKLSKKLSSTLMVTNLIATVLVIAIHYRSKIALTPDALYQANYLFQEFLTNGLAKTSVPFFAMISGFFLVEKLTGLAAYFQLLKTKLNTLVLPYALASTIIYISLEILKMISNNQHHDAFSLLNIVYNILIHPVSMQFWFLRDLILLVIISPLLIRSHPLINHALLIIILLLWLADIQPFPLVGGWYLISIDTLFFFCLGARLRNSTVLDKLIAFNHWQNTCVLLIWICITGTRVWLDPDFTIWYASNYTSISLLLHKVSILIGIISLIQIGSLFYKNNPIIYISGLTFFAYLFHLVPLSYFKGLTHRFVSDAFSFYVNLPIALILVFIMGHIVSKYLPHFYGVITGGRTPTKTVGRA